MSVVGGARQPPPGNSKLKEGPGAKRSGRRILKQGKKSYVTKEKNY